MPSAQQMAVGSGGGRRIKRSPYLDMIRGQYGQATQSVIQQKADKLAAKQRAEDLKLAEQNLATSQEANRLSTEQAKTMGRQAQIGTGISSISTASNLIGSGGKGTWGGGKNILGSSLIGYGASQLLNTSSSGKKWAAGIGAGLVADYAQGGVTSNVVNPLVNAATSSQIGTTIGSGLKSVGNSIADWWPF